MTRRFTTRTAGIFAALLLASCFGDSTGPGERRPGMVSIAPDFNVRGINAVDVNRVLVRFTKPNSTVTVYDTIVPFPASTDTLDLSIQLPINGTSEQFLMTILMIDDPAADTVFQSGPTLITAVAGVTPPTPVPASFTYVGVGSHAAGVRFLATPSQVLNGDTVLFAAEAFDSSNVTIPNTPIVWSSSDTVRAKVPADSVGRIVGGVGRGNVTITAALLTPPSVTSALLVQPKPASILVQGGSGQTGTVGLALSQPVAVQVKASDNLGVQGVVVNFAVTSGGGALSQLADTTDANGNASTAWTLGGAAGAQSVGVTVGGVAGTTSVPATGVAGAVKKLGFQTLPASVVSGQPITPAITVAAQDTFGNLVATFTGAVSLALGTNPAGGTLSGTTTVAAVAGVATFSGLSIDNIAAGYTFIATATGLVNATSGGLAVTAPAGANAWINVAGGNWGTASNWSKGTVPSGTDTVLIRQTGTYTVNLDVSSTVARLDLGATTGLQTLSIGANTLTMNGNGAVTANGRIVMTGGTISGPGVVDITGGLDWQAGNLSGGGGILRVQPGGTLSISGASARIFTNYTLELGSTGTWSGAGTINTGSGAVLRILPTGNLNVTGTPTFTNSQGGALTVLDNQGNLQKTTASGTATMAVTFNSTGTITVTSGVLSLDSGGTQSGPLSVAATTFLDYASGTYTLNNGLNATGAGAVRIQGATIATGTTADTARFQNLTVNGGNLGHSGGIVLSGTGDWAGGNISGTGTVRVATTATLNITGTATRTFTSGTLLNQGATAWSGTHTINTGLGAVWRNAAGGTVTISGDGSLTNNQGGSATFDNLGTLTRSTSAGVAVIGAALSKTGAINVNSGTLQFTGGSTAALTGTATASTGTLDINGGTFTQTGPVDVTGNLLISGGTWVPAGFRLTTSGNFTTSGAGLIDMTVASDSVDINGNASFGGGNGTLTTGVIRVAGNFTQTGTTSFRGQGGATRHRVVLDGAGTQIVNWADPVNSFFEILQYQKPAATQVQFVGNTRARLVNAMNFNAVTLTSLGGATTPRLLADTLRGVSGHSYVSPLVLEIAGRIADSGLVNVDTVVFTGANQVITDRLSLGTSLYGYKSIRVAQSAGTATLSLLSAPLAVANDLIVSSGTLALGGSPVSVTGNFSTSGSGALSMTSATDSLDINGSANFGGGASTLSAGGIRLAGNFVQSAAAASFAATGAHHLILDGAVAQTVSFANATSNFFRRLEVNKSAGGVVLSTDTRVTGTFRIVTGTSVTGPTARLTVQDSIKSPTTLSSLTPLVVEVGNWLASDSGAFSPDTAVFLVGSATATPYNIPTGVFTVYVYKSIRVAADTVTALGTLNVANDLVVGGLPAVSATLALATGSTINVTGNLRTEGNGKLKMTNATTTLNVAGSASFAGGATTGLLTTGLLAVKGNFSQSGNAASFAASGAHTTRFDLAGSAVVQNINFANPTTSFFHALDLNRGPGTRGTVNFQTDARINNGLTIQNSTDVTGATARISIVGGSLTASQSTTSPTMLTTRALELAVTPPALANMVGAVNISPDTVVINTGITVLPVASGLRYNSIRVNTGAVLTMSADTITRDLDVASGNASFPNTFFISGKLRTRGTGTFSMPIGGAPNVTVVDSAIFGGGSTAAQLQTGNLRLRGDFVQTGTNSFQANAAHATAFENTTRKTISMAAPGTGAAQSRFGQLVLDRAVAGTSASVSLGLLTSIQAGLMRDTATGAFDSIFGTTNQIVTVDSIQISNMVFDHVPLVLGSTTAFISANNTRWQNMDPTSTYLTLTRSLAGSSTFGGGTTMLGVPTTGKYFSITTTATHAIAFVAPINPAAASMTGLYTKVGATTSVTWGGISLP